MNIAGAQITAPATADLTGLYLYSWGQCRWCVVLEQIHVGDDVSYRVEGQDSLITAKATDNIQVCLP